MYSTSLLPVKYIYGLITLLLVAYFWKHIRRFYYISKIPGPPAWPIFGNSLMLLGSLRDISRVLRYDLVKYTPFFRIWLGLYPCVIISKPELVQIILTSPKCLEKPFLMKKFGRKFFRDPILISDVQKWKRHRKFVLSGFSQNILNSFLPEFIKQSEILVQQIRKEATSRRSFDVYKYMSKATFDAVCGAALGMNMGAQINDSKYFHALESQIEMLLYRGSKIWLHPDFMFNRCSLKKQFDENNKIIWDIIEEVIDKKRKHKSQTSRNNNTLCRNDSTPMMVNDCLQKNPLKKPFLDFMLDLVNADNEITDAELKEEVNIVILGAYETAAITASYMLLTMGSRKDIQAKVHSELSSVFGDSKRPIEQSDFPNLVYMEMVIKETLRLFPTVPYIIREFSEDMQIGNHLVPANTICFIPMFYLHRDPKIWSNPEYFDPERFLPENISTRHPFSFIPFSAGPRNCIGIKYAMMFLKTVLSTVLRNYEIDTELDLNKIEFSMELSLKAVDGHLIKVTPRKQT